jgi:hypothetical protein
VFSGFWVLPPLPPYARPGACAETEVTAAVGLLRKTPGVDPGRIVVVGHSLGAMVFPGSRRPLPAWPAEYEKGGFVAGEVVADLASFVLARGAGR